MKHTRILSLLLALALVFACLPAPVRAAESISGTVTLSSLPENAEVTLAGNTTLIVNVDKTIKSISGDHALTIKGEGTSTHSLVIESKGHGISAYSLDISSCIIVIESKRIGLNIERNIVMNSGLLSIDAGKDGIYSSTGSLTLNGGIIDVGCGNNCAAISLEAGDLNMKAGQLEAHGAKYGIYAKTGTISLNGDVYAGGSGWGIWAKSAVNIVGGQTKARGGVPIQSGGKLLIEADVDAAATYQGTPVISASGDIVINYGNVVADSKDNGSAVVSYGGSIVMNGGKLVASGAKEGIVAEEGSIHLHGVVEAYACYAIWAKENVRISSGSTTAKGPVPVHAGGEISVFGDLTAKATAKDTPAIGAGNGIVVKSGTVIAECSTNGTAMVAYSGDISINGGSVTASGVKNGVSAEKGAIIVKSSLTCSGFWPIWAEKGVTIAEPNRVLVPAGGKAQGKTVVSAAGDSVQNVQIGVPAISGTVNLDTPEPHPGSWVRYNLSGEVFQLYRNGVKLTTRWLESPDGKTHWKEVEGDVDSNGVPVYKCGVEDLGKYLQVSITAEGYKGYLTSTPRLVTKSACYVDVTAPNLIISSNKVFVNNARTNQQYLIFNYKKNIDSLTESDWSAAVTPEVSGLLDLGGTVGRTYYVYTRVMGSSIMEAGTDVRSAAIYLGETVNLQDFTLNVTDKNGTALEKENGNIYYCKINEPVRIAVEPIPSNATFNGIYYNNWINNAQNGAFYEDAACTKALQSGQYYKLVYFKPTKARNGADIAAEFTRGYNDVIHTGFYLNVADSSGNWLAVSASSLRITARAGETVEDVPVTSYPSKAGLQGMTIQLRSGEGTAPVLTLRPETKTVDVDATKADLGVFYYDLYQNGTKITGGFTVEVVTEPVEAISLLPETLTGEPGMSYELAVQCYPSGATGEALWATSNSKVATVSKGVVTFASGAEIGQSATITATVNGCKASCEVTVAGEVFDLTVDGTKVTTRNMDDVLGNGVFSFDGFRTLTVSGSYTGSKDVISNNGVESLVIRAEKDSVLTCTRESNSPILLRADTTITGPGKLTLSGGDTGVYLTKTDGTLTIRDASLNVSGNWGVGGTNSANNAVLVIDHADIVIDSGYGAICDFGGGVTLTDCEIAAPADGKISDDGKDIVDGTGTRCAKLQIQATARANPFEDVAEGTYYYDAVLWAVNHNPQITNGTDETHFSPDATCTRGQVVTFLWRAAGEPEPTGDKNPFTDVKSGAYYYKAVLWALEKGITTGTSATTFSPNSGCTRGQVVTFLHRAQGTPTPGSSVNPFTDVKSGQYYYEAVLWAVNHSPQITKGTGATAFSPNQTCTRAQIVTFLYRDMK